MFGHPLHYRQRKVTQIYEAGRNLNGEMTLRQLNASHRVKICATEFHNGSVCFQ